jgi:hypothetical protein
MGFVSRPALFGRIELPCLLELVNIGSVDL